MPTFTYLAIDGKSGTKIEDSLTAVTTEAAVKVLLERDYHVLTIEQHVTNKGARSFGRGVPLQDLVIFTRQFATMFGAGMSVVACLKALARQTRNKLMRYIIEDVCARVERGESLSEALAKNPRVFNKLYICMVKAGEGGGLLAEVLGRVATYLESTARMRRKIKSAITYPALVTVVAVGITIFLLLKVVPVFGEIFASFKGKLPGATLFLIGFSNFVQTWFVPMLAGAIAVVCGWIYFLKTEVGREFWDGIRIRLPVFGTLAHNICLARFARTFSSLMHSGVPILSVMQTVSKACGNVVMEKAVLAAAGDIELGNGIADALAKHPIFPDMVIRMLAAGEETGGVDEMAGHVADYLDEEIETSLSVMTSLIEPILIAFLGIVVGSIVVCMFMPIFKLSDLISSSH